MTAWANDVHIPPTEERGLDRVGCDISHHFPYAYSFSDGMGTAEYLAAVECHDGKEICPAATKPSSVVRHDLALLVIGANHRTLRAG